MEFGITIPLQKFLKLKAPEYGDTPDLFFCWEVHRAEIQGLKLLVAVNSSNHFCAMSRMTGAKWKHWEDQTAQAIRVAMECSKFTSEQIEDYFAAAGPIVVTKTHGRKPVASMNRAIEDLWPNSFSDEDPFQRHIYSRINDHMIAHCPTRKDYVVPAKAFAEDLAEHGIKPHQAKIIDFKTLAK